MRITFLGAAGTVTGSRYLVRAGSTAVLVDCGLFQGYKPLRLRNWAPLGFDAAALGGAVLTHAHLDHSGALPLLWRAGYRGRVHCTESTYDLCRILLADSAWLQEEQAAHANRHGYSKHRPALPLYTRDEVREALKLFQPHPFHKAFDAGGGLRATLTPAGHILGAACVTLEVGGKRIVFSGDLGRPADAVMRPPETIAAADVLVLESTYGDRTHPTFDPVEALGRTITSVAARGGTVVVPTFAVGRAQSLLVYLNRLRATHAIPHSLRIYLDSPMARQATQLYLRHPGEHRLGELECRQVARVARAVANVEESRLLDRSPWPKVILAGSGMATGGRVLHHIKRYGPDVRSAIVFAGFQAGGTRGDALVHGAREVKIQGEYVPVRAEVVNLEGLSAHADWREILGWLGGFRRAPSRVFLTHGEPAALDALRRHIAEELRWDAHIPEHLEVADLEARKG